MALMGGWVNGGARRPSMRLAGLALLSVVGFSAAADDFVDVSANKVFARKGGLACGSADAARSGGGFLSPCLRLPIAMRVKLVDSPEPMTQVYEMRIVGAGTTPKVAWFSRASLTNNPGPGDFAPDP